MIKRNEQKYLLSLTKAILLSQELPVSTQKLDWQYIYTLSKYHRIDNIVAYGVESLKTACNIPEEIVKKFLLAKQKGVAREAVQSYELDIIAKKFEENKISNLPLKGSVLKKYYPSSDMRFLTDLDILFKDEDKELVNQVLLDLGYTLEHPGDNHDVYIKKPFMVVEMHYNCYTHNDSLDKFFSDIWSRSNKVKNSDYSYQMQLEDYYIFMIGHMAKHFIYGGIGIKSVLDILIFNDKLKAKCNIDYINEQLSNANLLDFERAIENLLVSDEKNIDEELLDCILDSGAYGTVENNMNIKVLKDGGSKRAVIKNRIFLIISMSLDLAFPNLTIMKNKYNYLNKFPFLLPFAWIQRGIDKFITNRNEFITIIKKIFLPTTKGIDKMNKVLEKTGFDKGGYDGKI